MGAAAVFETAADTPPTVDKGQQQLYEDIMVRKRLLHVLAPMALGQELRFSGKRGHTQEVHHEGLGA